MAAVGRKSVCGLQYHRSRVRIKNSNLIEKMVSKRTVKTPKPNHFLPFFFASPLFFNKLGQSAAAAARKKYVCGLRYHGLRVRPKNSNSIEKMVSKEMKNHHKSIDSHCSFFIAARS
jgi:hypothetical protein